MTLDAHPRSNRRYLDWLTVALGLSLVSFASGAPSSVVINVRELGAAGDGTIHLVREWIDQGRFRNMGELRKVCPSIQDANWSVDEAAFELAKTKLPPEGGTIYFPEGRYVAARRSWTIKRDHVRLLGDGSGKSVLLTGPGIDDALVLSPYRHVGWLQNATEQYPFQPASGDLGAEGVMLVDATWGAEFHPGDLVFIRNGACRFDQDYGEFNEILVAGQSGWLRFKHPLSRNYTLDQINWAGSTTADFTLPKPGRGVSVAIASEPGNFLPRTGDTVTIGSNLFEITGVGKNSLQLKNPGRGNNPAGSTVAAGARIAKSRAVIKVTQTSRDFRAEKLQFVGHRKVLNLSNSYEIEFTDCSFLRQPAGNTVTKGGLTIDGDGGRWARFVRCSLKADPAWDMQFARSFGNVCFDSCSFEDANVAFTEFNFDCEVKNCDFDFHGPSPKAVIIVGKSGGNFRITDNRIQAKNVAAIFDSYLDIQSQKHGGEGGFVIRNNRIHATGKTQVFRLNAGLQAELSNNSVITN